MSVPRSYRGRFAPSPTGPLHLGSLLAALGSWLLARHAHGEWWVRIEDLDPPRELPGAAAQQLQALQGLGLIADAPVSLQSQRSALYQAALDRLLEQDRAFHCRCSRNDLQATRGLHRRCVARPHGRSDAVRMRVPEGAQVTFIDALQGEITQDVYRDVGDFVLKRADGFWAYQLAVVVDDAAQGMTDIVRGADLLDSTPRQILLQEALDLPTPRYLHLPLLVGNDGGKLSKSNAAPAVDPGHPLPALHAAWKALGQHPLDLGTASSGSDFVALAEHHFDPGLLPRVRSIPLAAVHNEPVVNAV
jgi:glutamyl-Q tRNA(Asp) synthetase